MFVTGECGKLSEYRVVVQSTDDVVEIEGSTILIRLNSSLILNGYPFVGRFSLYRQSVCNLWRITKEQIG